MQIICKYKNIQTQQDGNNIETQTI